MEEDGLEAANRDESDLEKNKSKEGSPKTWYTPDTSSIHLLTLLECKTKKQQRDVQKV